MKVLQLSTHLNVGGISSYLYMTGSRLIRMGHEVCVLSAGGDMEQRFKEKNFQVEVMPIRTKNEFDPKLIFALPAVIRFVKREKFDLIHAHTRVTQVLASWVSFFTKVPYISTAHGYYKPRISRRIYPAWGKRVIAISPLVADELKKSHKLGDDCIRVVQNAIDIEDIETRLSDKTPFKIRMELGIPQDAVVVGCIARLVRDKGQEVLIKAVKLLKKDYPQIFLLIAGDGREKGRYQKLIDKLGLKNNARLIPSQTDITDIWATIDVFVHPATFREGFGLTLVEAMAARKPVIGSNIWAMNTVIRHQINGFLVEPKRPDLLAKMIAYVLANPAQVESITQNAYDLAVQLYSIDRMVSEMETVYNEVVINGKKRSK